MATTITGTTIDVGPNKLVANSAGNVGIGTASPAKPLDVTGDIRTSTGILFGTDTAAANTLDDYEEGTFNATVTTGTATYLHGRYVKVGSVVTATCLIYNFSNRTSTGDAISFQLPFSTPSGESYGGGGNVMFRYISSVNDVTIAPYISGSLLELFQCNEGNYTQIKHSQLANTSSRFYFTVTYRTA